MSLLKGDTSSRKRVVLAGTSFLSAIANTIALLLIARNMGPEILGSLAFLISFIGLFFFVGDLGNGYAFSRLLKDGHSFDDCYSGFILVKVKLTIVFGIIAGAMIGLYVFILTPEGYSPLHPMSMFMILGYFILMNVAQIWVVTLVEKRKVFVARSYEILESIAKVVMVAIIVLMPFRFGEQEKVLNLTMIYFLAAIMGLMVIRNAARKNRRNPVTDEIYLAYNDTSKKLLPFVAFGALVLNLDKVILWYFTERTFVDLGLYFGAQRITIFIGASSLAIQGIVFGAVSHHLKNGDRQSVSDTLRMTERYVTLLAMPVAAFYIFFSQDIVLAFLGSDFAPAGMAISLLAGAGLFIALSSPHIAYLISDEKYSALAVSSGVAFLILLTSLFAIVPDYLLPNYPDFTGINGAATSLLLSSLGGFILFRYHSIKHLGCKPHPRILTHVLSAGIMVVVLIYIGRVLELSEGLHRVLVFALLGILIYGISLYLSGEFLRSDFQRFKDLTKD